MKFPTSFSIRNRFRTENEDSSFFLTPPKYAVCTGRNRSYLFQTQWFQITADTHPGVSGVLKDQKYYEKFKNIHCQVDHSPIIE